MAAGQGRTRKRNGKEPPVFKHMIRIDGAEPVELYSIPKPRRQELVDDLCDRFMAALGYVPAGKEKKEKK